MVRKVRARLGLRAVCGGSKRGPATSPTTDTKGTTPPPGLSGREEPEEILFSHNSLPTHNLELFLFFYLHTLKYSQYFPQFRTRLGEVLNTHTHTDQGDSTMTLWLSRHFRVCHYTYSVTTGIALGWLRIGWRIKAKAKEDVRQMGFDKAVWLYFVLATLSLW